MKKKVLLGTTNRSKAEWFEARLSAYDIEFFTLRDLNITEEPEERGNTPEENAVIKARFYGQYFDAVICNDSGLYFKELDGADKRQPGLNIRTPEGGRRLDDEEMIAYYTSLVHSLGGKVCAYYLNGMAVCNNGEISSFMEDSEDAADRAFYMIDRPSEQRREGWPLDSISLNRDTLNYFVEEREDKAGAQEKSKIPSGFRDRSIQFFVTALGLKLLPGKNES